MVVKLGDVSYCSCRSQFEGHPKGSLFGTALVLGCAALLPSASKIGNVSQPNTITIEIADKIRPAISVQL